MLSSSKKELIGYIRELCLTAGEEVVLASGRRSNVYFNMKPLMMHSAAVRLAAAALLGEVPSGTDYIGGMEMGAVPLTTAMLVCAGHSVSYRGFFIRKASKGHGLRKRIEGVGEEDLRGKQVVLIEDVTTSGGSALSAARVVAEAGGEVGYILTLLDREEGAAENIGKEGIEFLSCLKASEVVR